MASPAELFVLEASRTHALVASQGVVTGGSSADVSTEAFIFICSENKKTGMCDTDQGFLMRGLGQATTAGHWPATKLSGGEGKQDGQGGEKNNRARCGHGCGLLPRCD